MTSYPRGTHDLAIMWAAVDLQTVWLGTGLRVSGCDLHKVLVDCQKSLGMTMPLMELNKLDIQQLKPIYAQANTTEGSLCIYEWFVSRLLFLNDLKIPFSGILMISSCRVWYVVPVHCTIYTETTHAANSHMANDKQTQPGTQFTITKLFYQGMNKVFYIFYALHEQDLSGVHELMFHPN